MNSRAENWDIISCLKRDFSTSSQDSGIFPAIREAKTFEYILENIPVFYCDGDLLAGDFGWCQEEEEKLRHFSVSPEKSPAPRIKQNKSPEEKLHDDFHCFGNFTSAHTCIDYEKLINAGIEGIIDEISAKKISRKKDKGIYLDAMLISMEALLEYVERFVELLENRLSVSKSRSKTLKDLIRICRKVPRKPAGDFHEALQSIWFVHSLIGISEYSDASISLGRFDQYLYPFYMKSLKKGISAAALEKTLHSFFVKLNRYGDAACTVNLGGAEKNGKDLCNPLTDLIIRVFAAGNFVSPILAARIHQGIPMNIFDQLTDPSLFIKGQPTFYGETPCRNALKKRGVSEDKIDKWAANSCMGLVIQGAEVSDMWGSVINFLLPLELTLNNGCPFKKTLPIKLKTKPCCGFRDFESLRLKFLEYLKEIIAYCIGKNQIHTKNALKERPNPFLSSFLNKCIERGLDRLGGGVEYYTVIVEAFGLVNVSDALFTIENLVFKENKYSLDNLICAVNSNFNGHQTILKDIRDIPKYGNGNAEADKFTAELADDFYETVHSFSNEKVVYAPSFHTLNAHIPAGKKYGASLDGRLSGDPLAKNIGTSPGLALKGYTSLIKSAAAIDQTKYCGGQALDISLDASLVNSPDGKLKFQALVRTYFELGGLQLQVNGLSAETLKAAIKEPEKYQDLIVRIAGYSDYFNRLGIATQQEMIRRFYYGM